MGTDDRQYGYINDESDAEQTIMEPVTGESIETSLDVGAQQIVEKICQWLQSQHGCQEHWCDRVMSTSTGEIIAMDGGDRYDLNNPRDMSQVYSQEEIDKMSDEETVTALNAMWGNFCVTDAFEVGSVVKPIVMAGALEKGKISATDTFNCDGGETFGANGDTYIKCAVCGCTWNGDLREVIANSCNDGMMQIAAKMGTEAFLKAQSPFNFGSRTGIDLPNEGAGVIHTTETMGETELACSAFGQGFTCTMLQEINAMCSVINGGYYYQPHLVTAIKDSSGGTVRTINRCFSNRQSLLTFRHIRSYMQASVLEGTSRTSKVEGYSSGGKTGTAEKLPRGNKKYIVSFITFAPVENPQVLMYVAVDEPNAEEQADSKYPQYIAQGILSELLPYLNVTPDESEDGTIPKTELGWEGFMEILWMPLETLWM